MGDIKYDLQGDKGILRNFCAYHTRKILNTRQMIMQPQSTLMKGYFFITGNMKNIQS